MDSKSKTKEKPLLENSLNGFSFRVTLLNINSDYQNINASEVLRSPYLS